MKIIFLRAGDTVNINSLLTTVILRHKLNSYWLALTVSYCLELDAVVIKT